MIAHPNIRVRFFFRPPNSIVGLLWLASVRVRCRCQTVSVAELFCADVVDFVDLFVLLIVKSLGKVDVIDAFRMDKFIFLCVFMSFCFV